MKLLDGEGTRRKRLSVSRTLSCHGAFHRRWLLWFVLFIIQPLMGPPASSGEGYSDRIAAIVNNEVITMSELLAELGDEQKRLKALFQGKQFKRRFLQKEYQVLNALIERKLQLQEAKTNGVTVTEEEFQQAMKHRPTNNHDSDAQTKAHLREQLLLNKLRLFEVRRNVMVPDSAVKQYYKEHQDQFMQPQTYRIRQILLLHDSDTPKKETQAKAESVYRTLREGGDFAELALKFSDGPGAHQGGTLGFLRHDELLAPIAQALKTMQPGDLSPLIETTLGFHIIVLDEKPSPKPKPFEEVEPFINQLLYKERSEETFQDWITKLKNQAFIDVRL